MNLLAQETRLLRTVLGITVLVFVAISLFGVAYPYTLEPYEGTVLLPALRVSTGLPIYGSDVLMSPPHAWAAYGPMYYFVTGAIMKASGVAFWPGRLLSLLATLGTGAVIAIMVRRTGSARGALLALCVFFALPTTWAFGALSRVDSLGLFFSVSCVALVELAGQRQRLIFLAGVAAAAAVLTKALLLAGPAAAALTILLRRDRTTRALTLFAAGALTVFLSFALLLHLTANGGFWASQLMNRSVPFSAGRALTVARAFFQSHIVLVSASVCAIGWLFAQRGRATRSVAVPFVFLATALAIVSAAKEGSSLNYFCELGAALAIGVGVGVAVIESAADLGPGARTLISLFVLLSTAAQVFLAVPGAIQGRVLIPQSKRSFYESVILELQRQVPAGGTVGGEYPELVLLANREVVQNDFAFFAVGPPSVRRIYTESLSARSVDAWIFPTQIVLPGYAAGNRAFVSLTSLSKIYHPGPIVYFRETPRSATTDPTLSK